MRQIPTNLNWYESPESAAHRAQLENVHMTAQIAGEGENVLRVPAPIEQAELQSIRDRFAAHSAAAIAARGTALADTAPPPPDLYVAKPAGANTAPVS